MIKMKILFIILCASLATMPLAAYAFSFDAFDENFFERLEENKQKSLPAQTNDGQTQIINKINVSADTGGNIANSGEVKEGTKKTEIQVNTIINGKEIDPVEIKSEASDVKVESKIEADEEKAYVERETEIDSVKESENYEVDLKQTDQSNISAEISAAPLQKDAGKDNKGDLTQDADSARNWWLELVKKLESFFQNILNIFK
jgi:hypothetical protein